MCTHCQFLHRFSQLTPLRHPTSPSCTPCLSTPPSQPAPSPLNCTPPPTAHTPSSTSFLPAMDLMSSYQPAISNKYPSATPAVLYPLTRQSPPPRPPPNMMPRNPFPLPMVAPSSIAPPTSGMLSVGLWSVPLYILPAGASGSHGCASYASFSKTTGKCGKNCPRRKTARCSRGALYIHTSPQQARRRAQCDGSCERSSRTGT